jgi:hypothetical protein
MTKDMKIDAIVTPPGNVSDKFVEYVPIPQSDQGELLVSNSVDLSCEDMEEVIAPYITFNHNEIIVCDEIELDAEELEDVIAPYISVNHNETISSDEVDLDAE